MSNTTANKTADALAAAAFQMPGLDTFEKAKIGRWLLSPEVVDSDLHLTFSQWNEAVRSIASTISFFSAACIFIMAEVE